MSRVQHQKKLKNAVRFYKSSFELHPPYIILCDPNFIFAAIDSKINILDRFTEIFKGQVYLKVTECGIAEVKEQIKNSKNPKFKRLMEETLNFCKEKCQLYKCNSHKIMQPSNCILNNLEHKFKGTICTNDSQLRNEIHRKYNFIPLFYIQNGLQIVPPSKKLKQQIIGEIEEKYSTVKQTQPKEPEEKPEFVDKEEEENQQSKKEEEEKGGEKVEN